MSARESWAQEKESVFLYLALAAAERAPERRELFARLAREAEAQAAIWSAEAARAGEKVPDVYVPRARTRLVATLARRLGPVRVRPILAAMKVRGLSIYGTTERGHAMPLSIEDVGQRHHAAGAGNLRAAVFGINDGLVSNASLILGVAGATTGAAAGAGASASAVVVSGIAGLLAGAFSMAAGEYVSVRTQREMFEHQIVIERAELAQYPEQEAAELSLIYEARGLPREDADRVAACTVANPAYALDTLTREELGLDPTSLSSPWGAAAASFVSFAVGAFIPLVPFLAWRGGRALPVSVAVTAASLFGVGATTSLFSGRSAAHGGLRMLVIGAAAAGATFLVGRLLGVATA